MKKYFYLPIILSFFVSTTFGQSNSFVTKIPGSYYYHSVISDLFGTYLIAYSDTSNLPHLARLDNSGNVLWDKIIYDDLAIEYGFRMQMIKSNDNSYYSVLASNDTNVEDSLIIQKFSFYGEITKSIKINLPLNKFTISSFPSGDLLLTMSDNKKINLVRLDNDLNILKIKSVDYNYYYSVKAILIDNKIILNTGYKLGIIDSDLQYTPLFQTQDRIFDIIKTSDDKIIYIDKWNIYKIDLNGENIWIKNHNQNFNYAQIVHTIDNNYKCLSELYTLFSEFGDIITTYPIGFMFESIAPTLDNGIIGVGNDIKKLDSNGDFYLLGELNLPLSSTTIHYSLKVHDLYTIRWLSGLPGNVKIEFSTNDGYSWELLDDNISAKGGRYLWLVPDKVSDKCKIRISSIDFPQYTIQSSNTFSIVPQFLNYIAINNHKMYYDVGKRNPTDPYHEILYWPGGEKAIITATFDDGLYWSGKINNDVQVGGQHFATNLQAGNIISPDSAADPNAPRFQSWRFKKNWEELPDGTIKSRYQHDYENWPIDLGAPWIDSNYDGIYNVEDGDKPDTDADELHWMVMNDMNYDDSNNYFESQPFGLEVQLSIYGYQQNNFLDDVLFKRYLLINKSNDNIEDMYLCYFADNDFGYSHDDFVGCDTTLNLGFTWNAYEFEDVYGFPPPAMGHMIVQGPITEGGQNESAIFGGKRRNGYKNIGMTAFGANYKNDPVLPRDPGDKMDYINLMKGLNNDGSPIIDPTTGEASTKHVYGDPETGTGWIDGTTMFGTIRPADRRYYITTGPFNLASQDTQEIVIAVLATKGTSNKNSVTELKNLANNIREFYYSKFPTNVDDNNLLLPNQFQLYQNYPNPFNPSTTIEYSIPDVETLHGASLQNVTLKIYDILGREVTTLVNQKQSPGNYKIIFDGKNLSSGVYFYQLITNNFSQTRKMLLIK
ncbi:MAG: T9SS type A sorting domain-containing protein [Bacteroidota bacterium]